MPDIDPARELRIHRLLTLVCLACTATMLTVAMTPAKPAKSLAVETLQLVDANGVPRLVLAATLPNPRVGGKEYPRSSPATGLQFNDAAGNETGGLAMFEKFHGGALCFDYPTAEALCVSQLSDFGYVGLTMLDKPAAGTAVGKSGAERVVLAIKKEASQLTLNDSAEKPRITLEVSADGTPHFRMLDAEGRPLPSSPK